MGYRRLLARLVGALGVLLWALFATTAAWARPGGGGSYHGGGGGGGLGGGGGFGGGGHFGGGGGFGGVAVTTSSGQMSPLFVLLFVGVIALVIFATVRRQQRFLTSLGGVFPRPGGPAADLLAPLRARDPGLTEQSIREHVGPMSEMLRVAWCGGDMSAARPFVSDGIFSRYQVQLELMREENRRNVMDHARLLAVDLVAVEDAHPLDVVHVKVSAEARDTEVPWSARDDEVRAALARTRVEPYAEIWSLVRRRGVQSKPSGFAVGRACPSCGAPLPPEGVTLRCRYCGALVCSGEFDWVLAEITQMVEWRPSAGTIPGLQALRARDADVAREVIEDRASYLFWKWIQAGRAGNLAPLRKCATASLLAAGARLEGSRGASDISVGGTDLARCEVGGADGFDRALVQISWSARFSPKAAHSPMKMWLRLARRMGTASRPSMTALACAACGAPLAESDSSRCDHCGAELASGDQAWVLEEVAGC